MRLNKINFTLATIFVVAFTATAAHAESKADAKFESVANTFIEHMLKLQPEQATQLGDHRYDARTTDFSQKGMAATRALFHKTMDQLAAIPAQDLSLDNNVDKQILENNIKQTLFDFEVMNTPATDSTMYNPANGIYLLLSRDYAPLKTRLAAVDGRLKAIPATLAVARQNLKNPPRVYTETAIVQNKGAISLIQGELDEFIAKEPSMKAKLAPARKRAIAALTEYGTWLEKDLLPRSTGDFRIGEKHFREKLALVLDSDLTPEDILKNAEADLATTQAAMLETALPLYKRYYPDKPTDGVERKVIIRAVLDKIAEDKPTNDSIVNDANKKLAAATDFVREHQFMTMPTEPVKAIVMPEFARGFAVAYCDAAGPLEKNGQTYFDISPTPTDWSPERVTSFYREYNEAMLNELTIHEAMPGHYLQLSIAKKAHPPTNIRALFGSGTFIEGWATYAEQVMATAGFGGPETKMQQLKMRLRLVINAILDQKIHAGNMSEQEAMAMMMNDGYQEDGEAAGKWRRARLSSTQLSTYFVGNLEVNALYKDLSAKTGGDMKSVHDKMLTSGSIATKYIRQLNGL
jgi:uncharacterized protein (DUF885 family)